MLALQRDWPLISTPSPFIALQSPREQAWAWGDGTAARVKVHPQPFPPRVLQRSEPSPTSFPVRMIPDPSFLPSSHPRNFVYASPGAKHPAPPPQTQFTFAKPPLSPVTSASCTQLNSTQYRPVQVQKLGNTRVPPPRPLSASPTHNWTVEVG